MPLIKSLSVLLVLIAMAWSASVPAEEEAPQLLPAGKIAPSFSLPTLTGTRQTLSIWCGNLTKKYTNDVPHTVILSFWATYCKPCQKEIPELMKFAKQHEKDPIKIFCISLDKEGAGIVAPFVKEKGYTLPVLLDPYKRTALRYGVKSLPALVVIGPDGIIRYSSVGYKDNVSLMDILERAYKGAVNKQNIASQPQEAGESIDVKQDTNEKAAPRQISARDKWRAVARVECGEAISDVADELGVDPEKIKQWNSELKAKAQEIWKDEN